MTTAMRALLGLAATVDRRVLIAGAVGVTMALVLLVGRRPESGLRILGTAILAAGAYLVLARLERGILLIPVVGVLVPFEVGTGTASTLVASLLLTAFLIGLWLLRMLSRRSLVVRRSPINLPLAGFLAASAVSMITSNVARDPLVTYFQSFPLIQLAGLSIFLLSGGLVYLAMNTLATPTLLRQFTWIMALLGAATIVAYYLPPGRDLPGSAVGGLFSLWVVSLAVGQAAFNRSLPWPARGALLLLAAAWFYRRLFHEFDWISGWLPMLAALATICALRSWRLFLLMVAGAALVFGLNFGFFTERYAAQVEGSEAQGNYERVDVWSSAFEITKKQLPFGLGPAGYAPYYLTYQADAARSSHSNYIDIFAQTGVVGSFFFLWFLAALYVVAFRARRRPADDYAAGFANGALGGLVGVTIAMALGDWVIPFVYNQTIAGFRFTLHSWLCLGVLAGLPYLRRE
jgi:hypothetical protein